MISGLKGILSVADKFMARVVIYNNNYYIPILPMITPLGVEIFQERTPTKFTVEDGTQRTDHVTEHLKKIVIDVHAHSYLHSTYLLLNQLYKSRELVTIQTNSGVFYNMLLTSIPIKESKENRGSLNIKLQFQEWREVAPKFSLLDVRKVSSFIDAKTKELTSKVPDEIKKGSSLLYDAFKGLF